VLLEDLVVTKESNACALFGNAKRPFEKTKMVYIRQSQLAKLKEYKYSGMFFAKPYPLCLRHAMCLERTFLLQDWADAL